MNVIGIANIASRSFSGDALTTTAQLRKHMQSCIAFAQGIDIGAESTAPGSDPVPVLTEKEFIRKALQVLEDERHSINNKFVVSIDTRKSDVAEMALKTGLVNMINDVSAGRYSSRMMEVVARYPKTKYVMMHSINPNGMALCETSSEHVVMRPENVFPLTHQFFEERIAVALAAGIQKRNIVLDPGMGRFLSLGAAPSISLLVRDLKQLQKSFPGYKWMVGVSRKSFLNSLSGFTLKPEDRIGSSLGVAAYLLNQNTKIDYLRVHDHVQTSALRNTMLHLKNEEKLLSSKSK
eukprot:PhF_6_TR6371/c0_g1_i1/m.9627/K00796/folP; dihydropteroate synthase